MYLQSFHGISQPLHDSLMFMSKMIVADVSTCGDAGENGSELLMHGGVLWADLWVASVPHTLRITLRMVQF